MLLVVPVGVVQRAGRGMTTITRKTETLTVDNGDGEELDEATLERLKASMAGLSEAMAGMSKAARKTSWSFREWLKHMERWRKGEKDPDTDPHD